MRRLLMIILLSLLGLLPACDLVPDSQQPLVIVATSEAPDAGFRTYQSPSEVFSIRIPPGWIPDQLPDENGVRTQFSSVEANESVVRLSVYIVNTGQPLTPEAFLQAVNAYQPPQDLASAAWTAIGEPVRMSDNSVRLTGLREYPTLGRRELNIFLQGNGSYFSALELDVTDADPAQLQTLMAVVNTYRVNPNTDLFVGEVSAAGITSTSGVVAFEHYHHWQDSSGGFNITGMVTNTTSRAMEAVRMTAYLYDSDNTLLAERPTILGYDVLGPGMSAPFRIRFDTGRPSRVLRYELHAAARSADFALQRFYGNENFFISNVDTTYSSEGFLTLTGEVQNVSNQVATSVKIISALFDDAGKVVATESSFINKETLLPGEITRFEITVYDMGGDALRYDLLAQGSIQ